MNGLAGIDNRALEKRMCPLPQIKLTDGFRTQLEQFESETVLARVRILLNKPVALEHHDQPMRRALVQLKHLGELAKSEVGTVV